MSDVPGESLKTVPLNDRHVALGGRMVAFSGYSLPVQYPTGIIAEHRWTREHAGLFDVSHMGPSYLKLSVPTGDPEIDQADIASAIEPILSADIAGLRPGMMRYGLLLNPEGGIVDDLMVANLGGGELYIVVNAGTKDDDFARIAAAAEGIALLRRADDHVLLALQGPEAEAALRAVLPQAESLSEMGFMQVATVAYDGAALQVTRSGYTGEDGYEILIPAELSGQFWDALLADPRVRPIGLGARDSLRLEAGLPLYGHDLDETVSPIEAGLAFALGKRRREAADFPGAERVLRELRASPSRRRVGLLVDGAPAREGAPVLGDGAPIGTITSGGFSPSLGRAIALGYVPPALAAPGTVLAVEVRGRAQRAEVVALPFVPHRYHRKPARGA